MRISDMRTIDAKVIHELFQSEGASLIRQAFDYPEAETLYTIKQALYDMPQGHLFEVCRLLLSWASDAQEQFALRGLDDDYFRRKGVLNKFKKNIIENIMGELTQHDFDFEDYKSFRALFCDNY